VLQRKINNRGSQNLQNHKLIINIKIIFKLPLLLEHEMLQIFPAFELSILKTP